MKKIIIDGIIGWDVEANNIRDQIRDANGEELEIEIQNNSNTITELREKNRSLHKILSDKLAKLKAKTKIERMSDPEKVALFQELQAESIESEEKFGEVQ